MSAESCIMVLLHSWGNQDMHFTGVSVGLRALGANPGIVWHFHSFSLPCFLENILQPGTFMISKHSEKCCLTIEQILLDCFGLRIATLLKISQSSVQEARYFVWTEHKSKLEMGAAWVPCSEALSSLWVPLQNPRFQTSGTWFRRSACSKLTLAICFHSVASRPVSRMQCKIVISWTIMQFCLKEGH